MAGFTDRVGSALYEPSTGERPWNHRCEPLAADHRAPLGCFARRAGGLFLPDPDLPTRRRSPERRAVALAIARGGSSTAPGSSARTTVPASEPDSTMASFRGTALGRVRLDAIWPWTRAPSAAPTPVAAGAGGLRVGLGGREPYRRELEPFHSRIAKRAGQAAVAVRHGYATVAEIIDAPAAIGVVAMITVMTTEAGGRRARRPSNALASSAWCWGTRTAANAGGEAARRRETAFRAGAGRAAPVRS
jgi:hypothetical protein